MITERNTITRVHKHLSWETLKEKKTQQNFLNIDSQYNAKIMNQTTHKFLFQGCASLSLPSSGNW
jgi:hypothetical protein